jgi:hypothetical protein
VTSRLETGKSLTFFYGVDPCAMFLLHQKIGLLRTNSIPVPTTQFLETAFNTEMYRFYNDRETITLHFGTLVHHPGAGFCFFIRPCGAKDWLDTTASISSLVNASWEKIKAHSFLERRIGTSKESILKESLTQDF